MKRGAAKVVMVLAVSLLPVWVSPALADWHQDYRNALKAFDRNEYGKAEKLLRRALKGRREPGKNLLPSVGLLGGVIENYCPRLMLAASLAHQEGREDEKAKLLIEAWDIERDDFGEVERHLYEDLTRTESVEKEATPRPTAHPLPSKPEISLERDDGREVRVVWRAEAGADYEVLVSDHPSPEGSSVRRFFPVSAPFTIPGEAPGRHYVSVRAKSQGGQRLSDWRSFDVPEPAAVRATPTHAPVGTALPAASPRPVPTPQRKTPRPERTLPPVPSTPQPTPTPVKAAMRDRDAAAMIAEDLDQAVASLQRADISSALPVLEAIVHSDPKNGRACLHLAACYCRRFIDSGQRDGALRERAGSLCRRARTLDPTLPWRSEIQDPAVLLLLDNAAR